MKNKYRKLLIFFFSIFYKRKSYKTSRSSYYNLLLDDTKSIQIYLKLLRDLKSTNAIETSADIQLIDDKKNKELNKRHIIKKHGNPNYKFVCEDLSEIDIWFYRQKFASYRAKIEFHFFNDTLFLYTFTFSYLNPKEKNEIIKIINEKYLTSEYKDLFNYHIVDKNKNIIMLNDKTSFSIKYLCKNNNAFEKIIKHDKSQKFKDENKLIRNLEILYERL